MQDREMIVVALSGGVDSATAAAMLVEAGFRVVGITMRLYNARGTASASGGRCCGPRDMEDARKVCSHLGIPFYVANYEDEFRRAVIDDFVSEYVAGRTPNPCVRCNEKVKFAPLLARARALGASKLATGHYARIDHDARGPRLLRGVDENKDQSYFLFPLLGKTLESLMFPLGGLTKEEVREKARAYGIPNAGKPESQEICFVPDGDHVGFVERISGDAAPRAGEVVDIRGRVLGSHDGVHRFTVGQRRGLGGALGGGQPMYVVSVDALTRRVTVGSREETRHVGMRVADVRWMGECPSGPLRAEVQIRHRHRAVPGSVIPDRECGSSAMVSFDSPLSSVAPGQAAVFYQNDVVMGGGWIESGQRADN
ncbi:MAG: tRNA 2-thiouridine(34) synthase MnmA [Deltaproteobacteria bacterium]|nr:tRNA 2-thiouridine(34) synthase MnmA [Deltaproteobacteria bacterium]